MSQAPTMPFYTDAYLADTKHLSCEEHGAYLQILFVTWRNNGQPLPDDDKRMARIVGLTPTKWRKVRAEIEDFFDISEGFWRQKKLEKTWESVSEKIEQNRENGKKGGRPKAQKTNDIDKADGSVSINQTETEPEPKQNQSMNHKPLTKESPQSPPRGPDRFDEFKAVYPSRGKAANPWEPAREKWRIALKAGADPDDIIRGAKNFAAIVDGMKAKPDFDPATAVAQAKTWLNQKRWKDYLDAPAADPFSGLSPRAREIAEQTMRERQHADKDVLLEIPATFRRERDVRQAS